MSASQECRAIPNSNNRLTIGRLDSIFKTWLAIGKPCCHIESASRVGLTPSPTCQTGQGGSRKGMRPLRQRNGSRDNVSPPRITDGGIFYVEGAEGQCRRGEFIEDTSERGIGRERRGRAREIYESNIRQSPVHSSETSWKSVRDRWDEALCKALMEKIGVSRLHENSERWIYPHCALKRSNLPLHSGSSLGHRSLRSRVDLDQLEHIPLTFTRTPHA
jgi:hypothetical protein